MTVRLLFLVCLVARVTAAQSAPPRKDIPAIAKAAKGAIVSIIMSDRDGKPIAQGTGFVVSKDGVILTNYHVIAEGSSAIVKLPDGAFYVVEGVLASDKARDVAVIKAHGENFRTLTLGNSDRIQVGEEVVAIGNPLSLDSTVSNGIISGIRTIEDKGGKFLQITAPISPGSSGGALFNMAGEVIGITTMYRMGGENLNFAIPVNETKRLLLNQSAKLQELPNETPAPEPGTSETRRASLAEQKACSDQVERMSLEHPLLYPGGHTSHFDTASGICYMARRSLRYPPDTKHLIWVHVIYISDAFEDRTVGTFNETIRYSENGQQIVGRGIALCHINPPDQPEITCKSEEEFNALALKYFGITQQ
jgi:Trypsin-like peptidase domain